MTAGAGRTAAAMMLTLGGIVAATALAAWLAVISADGGESPRARAGSEAGRATPSASPPTAVGTASPGASTAATSAGSNTATATPEPTRVPSASVATATRVATATPPAPLPTASAAPAATAVPSLSPASSPYRGNISFDSDSYAIGATVFHCHSLLPEGGSYVVRISQTEPVSATISEATEPGDGRAHCSSLALKASDAPQFELRAEFFVGGALVSTASASAAVR